MNKKISYNQQSFGSIFKLIKYLGYLTKVPMTIEIEGVKQRYVPPERVVISSKFFRSYECISCGKCCTKPKFSLAYTASDYVRINGVVLESEMEKENQKTLISNMIEVPVMIELDDPPFDINKITNVVKYKTYCWLFSNDGHQCSFLFEKEGKQLCGIHQVHPNHCALPHLQVDQFKSVTTSVIKRQYGRNWALGCKAKEESFNHKEFLAWDLPCLHKLKINADDFNMDTWIPEIITYLEEHSEQFKKNVPSNPIVIYDKKLGIPGGYLVKD